MDVMGTVRTVYNKALNLIAYRFLDESTRGFVVSDFLNKDNNKQRLFLSATDPSLEALLGATAAVLVKYNLAQPNTKTKLIAYYLDEFLSFSKSVDSEVIAEMSRVGRSKGMCTYKLFQSFPKFSEDEYKEIVANCQFIVFFPVTEPGSLEEIGKQVGDIEYLERKHVEQDNGKQTVETNIKDRIITPEIITSLQKEGHSHIFFSPKMQVLTKAYTRMSATDEKNWIKDIIENQIDSNKYYKFLDEFYEGEGKNVFEAVGIDEKEKSEYEKELNNLLKEIVADYQQQFKNNEEYLSYKLTTSPEKLDSKHGDYTFKTKQIRIFNMINISREHFVGTAIHELAHHIEYIDKGSTGHSKNFYTIYKRLIDIAVKKDFIKYSIMAKEKLIDSSDIRQLEKFFPELKQIGDKSKGKGEEVTHSW
jgi:predicted SprT family Zn-dependent metalloprotease